MATEPSMRAVVQDEYGEAGPDPAAVQRMVDGLARGKVVVTV